MFESRKPLNFQIFKIYPEIPKNSLKMPNPQHVIEEFSYQKSFAARANFNFNFTVGSSSSKSSIWDDVNESNILDSRTRRTASGSSNTPQPPPAHQHARSNTSNVNYKSTVIPGTSSTLTPIDLSGGRWEQFDFLFVGFYMKNFFFFS